MALHLLKFCQRAAGFGRASVWTSGDVRDRWRSRGGFSGDTRRRPRFAVEAKLSEGPFHPATSAISGSAPAHSLDLPGGARRQPRHARRWRPLRARQPFPGGAGRGGKPRATPPRSVPRAGQSPGHRHRARISDSGDLHRVGLLGAAGHGAAHQASVPVLGHQFDDAPGGAALDALSALHSMATNVWSSFHQQVHLVSVRGSPRTTSRRDARWPAAARELPTRPSLPDPRPGAVATRSALGGGGPAGSRTPCRRRTASVLYQPAPALATIGLKQEDLPLASSTRARAAPYWARRPRRGLVGTTREQLAGRAGRRAQQAVEVAQVADIQQLPDVTLDIGGDVAAEPDVAVDQRCAAPLPVCRGHAGGRAGIRRPRSTRSGSRRCSSAAGSPTASAG